MPTPSSTTDGNRQPDPVAAADITKAATSPGRSAVPATHISWDLSNPIHRLRRPDQTRVKTKCGRRTLLDHVDDFAPTCTDCTVAMRTAAIELLVSIRDPVSSAAASRTPPVSCPGGTPAASPTTRASRRTSMTRSPRCWPTGPPATPRGRRYTALPSSSRIIAWRLARVGSTSRSAS